MKVTIAGGSIGGLCAGIALRGIGADVQIFERESGPMDIRGAGIVVQPHLIPSEARARPNSPARLHVVGSDLSHSACDVS